MNSLCINCFLLYSLTEVFLPGYRFIGESKLMFAFAQLILFDLIFSLKLWIKISP